MIKVLQIIDGNSFGGICKLFTEVEKNISSDIKFEYLTATKINEKFYNLNVDRKSLKGRIIYNHRLYKFLKSHKYDIVHINSGAFFFTFFCAFICKIRKVKKVIVHSHNTPKISKIKRLLIKIINPYYRKITSAHLSCSKEASKSLFTRLDDVIIIHNGVCVNEFKFNKNVRNKYRKKLDLKNNIVYGHVGRFDKVKNHEFLIDVFKEIQNKQNAILLLIGSGKLEKEIKEKVKQLKLNNKILFLGYRKDVNGLMNAMDIFLLPSIHEGLPITLIESLCSGLPSYVSIGVTDEANISNNFHKINNFDVKNWTNKILNTKFNDRTNEYKNVYKNNYDIKDSAKKLEQIYKDLIR